MSPRRRGAAGTPAQDGQPSEPAVAWERAQWSPWPKSPARSGVSSRNNTSPPGGVIIIDASDEEDGDDADFYWD
jgi:hypothetical protein